MPLSSGTNVVTYSPSFDTVQSTGTSVVLPDGDVTWATTRASFSSVYDASRTSALTFTGSPGSTRSAVVVTFTWSGTPSTSHRIMRRQNIACVESFTAIFASMRQRHTSCTGSA